MKIWVDADACPNVIKDILYRVAERTKLQVVFVANKHLRIPRSGYIQFKKVPPGLDVADNEIAKNVESGDIVITADIPLAAKIVEKGAFGLNPRGEKYSAENIRERLSTRDFMEDLRSTGLETGGPPALTKRDRQLFANSLDQMLSKTSKK